MNTPRQPGNYQEKSEEEASSCFGRWRRLLALYREHILYYWMKKNKRSSRNHIEADWNYAPGFTDSFKMNKRRSINKENTIGNPSKKLRASVNDGDKPFASASPAIQNHYLRWQLQNLSQDQQTYVNWYSAWQGFLLFLQMKIVKTHEKHNLERGAVFCGRIQNLSLLT